LLKDNNEEAAMTKKLDGIKVAILATDGFEQSELFEPKQALEDAGADVHVIAPKSGSIKGWKHTDWGKSATVDRVLGEAMAEEYDAVMLPGGVMNPDKLRMDRLAVDFVRQMADMGKPIAAICHGPQVLIDADVVRGRTMTSWPSLRTDLTNAGANWVNEMVVTDNGMVTSRMPEDIPEFNRKMIEEFAEGIHEPKRSRRMQERTEARLQ